LRDKAIGIVHHHQPFARTKQRGIRQFVAHVVQRGLRACHVDQRKLVGGIAQHLLAQFEQHLPLQKRIAPIHYAHPGGRGGLG
jgi:hypothetical protein